MVVNEGGSDIYRRGLNKGAKKKKKEKNSAGKVAEDCSHSRPCGLRAAWLVEHLRHIGQ